jgi:predicted transcriptional regulator
MGMMFIGRDITPDIEEHGRLVEGMGYLIKERGTKTSVDLFTFLTRAGMKGLFVTRANPSIVSSWLPPSSNIETVMLTQRGSGDPSLSVPSEIVAKVERFASEGPSVILIDGGHYLIATLGFSMFLDLIFDLSETLASKRSILLVRIDPNLLDDEKMAYLENELLILPSQKIEDVVIEDEFYPLLKFIQEQNDNNTLVSLKKISSKLQISHVTVAKRVETLEENGLIFVRKMGKQRAPFLTEKGKALLAKRRTA